MAIINPGASVRVLPQAPQINPRDFAPDAEGLQRAQILGHQIGKELSDLSLAGDRLKVEKAKLKATEEELKFNQQLAKINMGKAIADADRAGSEAKKAATLLDPKEMVRREAFDLGLNPEDYGNNFDRLLEDVRRRKQQNAAMLADPSMSQALAEARFGQTLASSMQAPASEQVLPNVSVGAPAPTVPSVPPYLQKPQVSAAFEAPVVGTELAGVSVPAEQELAATDDALAQFDQLQDIRSRLAPPGTTPRSAAIALYLRDNPSRPLQSMTPAEQSEALKPYLDAAKSEVISRTFLSDGNSYKVDIRQSKDGEVVYGISEPLLQRSAPETTATATVKNKLAFIDETSSRIDKLLKTLDQYEKDGAFGVYDTWMATTAANPNAALPVRYAAAWLGNSETKKLVTDLATIGSKTMTELAGSAQTEGEAKRLGPYVPNPGDAVLGPKQLRDKVSEFRAQLMRSKESINRAFGLGNQKTSGAEPSAEAPEAPVQTDAQKKAAAAIESYRNRRAKAQ